MAGGYTSNLRLRVTLADGRRVFVKQAYSDDSAGWLRKEHRMYEALAGRPFMPALLGWYDEGEHPLLAIEDLSAAHWPPPWKDDHVDAVRATLDEVASTPPPAGLPRVDEMISPAADWELVGADPEPFLSLGLRTREWLDANYDALLAATRAARLQGDALLHLDVRSDNLCFRGGRALLVDWNWACVGNAEIDVATWLPSLYSEGGPPPWEVLPGRGEYAACMAGFGAARAGLPLPAGAAPAVRELQRTLVAVALEWAERELRLPS